jgi:hypothetical protein
LTGKPKGSEKDQIASGAKFYPLYPGLWRQPGEKCLHVQRRGGGRIDLVCARNKGHEANGEKHLHDVPPELQK